MHRWMRQASAFAGHEGSHDEAQSPANCGSRDFIIGLSERRDLPSKRARCSMARLLTVNIALDNAGILQRHAQASDIACDFTADHDVFGD